MLNVRPLIDLAENLDQLAPGEVRLVAMLDAEMPGIQIEPAAAQERRVTLVVANLRQGGAKPLQPDTNLPRQAKLIDPDAKDDDEPINP